MLDPKYVPLFLGGFVLWMIFIVAVGIGGDRAYSAPDLVRAVRDEAMRLGVRFLVSK